MEKDIHQLLERFVKGQASDKEQKQMEQLIIDNPQIKEELELMQALQASLIEVEIDHTRTFFQSLETKIQAETVQEKKSISPLKQVEDLFNYSVEQLKQLFAPVPAYEQYALQYALRAEAVALKHPQPDLNCTDYKLYFELEKSVEADADEDVEVIVENNQCEELLEEDFDRNLLQYTIDLDPEIFTPGRYYWKFAFGDNMVVGSFFIRKDLMPKNE